MSYSIRCVTEKCERGWWRVRVVESDLPGVWPGCLLAGDFKHPSTPGVNFNFSSRREAREALRGYAANRTYITVTGGLH